MMVEVGGCSRRPPYGFSGRWYLGLARTPSKLTRPGVRATDDRRIGLWEQVGSLQIPQLFLFFT